MSNSNSNRGSQTIRLNCVVLGTGRIFPIDIAWTESVGILKKVIKNEKKPEFDDIAADRLDVWKVDLEDDNALESNVERDIENKEPLSAVRTLVKVFPKLPEEERVHIIVRPPPDNAQVHPAVQRLQKENGALFKCLQVRVLDLKKWSKPDVQCNLNGGSLYPEANRTCPILVEIGNRMAQIRTFASETTGEDSTELHLALKYSQHLIGIYEPSEDTPPSVKDNREFGALFNILHYYHKDSELIKDDDSSSLKASNFTVYFALPPFFSCRSKHFKYKQEMSLGFPTFVATREMRDLWCTFTPKPDFMVSSKSSLCPFIVSEVVSQENESDRWRMLVEAIAIARAGQYLMKTGKRFFVVAIYLRKNLTAERYIVAQSQGEKVFISQKDFDLASEQTDAISFLREMYNLTILLEELEGNLDPKKKDRLSDIVAAAKGLSSLTAMARQNGKKDMKNTTNNTSPPTTLSSIPEGYQEAGRADDDLGVFGANDIQVILNTMKCKVDFIPFGHPRIAVVSNKSDDSKKGFLKFVREGRKETEILRYLTAIDSPRNHTISGAIIWPVSGGDIISMPMAGCWLTSVNNPDAHLWSIVEQLFEAVDFLHQHGVAHLDLKPGNILVPVDGGRLSIIDFNISVRVNGPNHKFCGVVGTPGYIPPEVEADRGPFSAVRADLWSCGKTLYELCNICRPSLDRNMLLGIAGELMNEDPEKRPMMSDILERLAYCKIDDNGLGCQRMAHRKIDTDSERFSSVGLPQICV